MIYIYFSFLVTSNWGTADVQRLGGMEGSAGLAALYVVRLTF